ncbi:phosphoglycerate mutase family protein [Kitasatospora sp. NPDC002227]|uniref:phosphoglycerate mutase family protein n=1 Tax=Kitasatospora sp. NPDC002227 TaxID=3154773 RepID=UPI00331B822E
MAVEIVHETHSTTADNEAGIATGRLTGELSELGRRRARELGARRPGHGFAAAFVSAPHRAVQTARIAYRDGPPLSIGTSGCATATTVIPTEAHSPTPPLNEPDTSTNGSPAARVTARSSRPPTPSATASMSGGTAAESWQSPARQSGGSLPTGRPSNDTLDTPPAWRPDWAGYAAGRLDRLSRLQLDGAAPRLNRAGRAFLPFRQRPRDGLLQRPRGPYRRCRNAFSAVGTGEWQ